MTRQTALDEIAATNERETISIGQRVRAAKNTLAYFCGDKTGIVEGFDGASIMVRMDRSGRVVPFSLEQLDRTDT